MTNLPAHSPLGGSGAERWMNCGGSVFLIKKLQLAESDEPDFRTEGSAAHHFAALCLTEGKDGWEIIGEKHENGVEAGEDMANAVQLYLDTMRPLMKDAKDIIIEQRFHRPDLHPEYFGTADFAAWYEEEALLDVTDYKHGIGIQVDVEWNAQLMYYAYGLLDRFPDARRVRLRIVQPRGFHPAGPIRVWEIGAEALCEWAEDELLPAMHRQEMDGNLKAGEWCRFCPAKLVCPLLNGLFGAAMKADPKNIRNMSNEALGLGYQYIAPLKFFLKAYEEEVYRLLTLGKKVQGTKLVAKKANRVFKPGAEAVLKARFGNAVYTEPEFKSPAAIEAISPEAKELMVEWAYTPFTGVTVAVESDKRPAVPHHTLEERFKGAVGL